MSDEQPRVTDNDAGEITVTLSGQLLRSWVYAGDTGRRTKMLAAREYVEGWCEGHAAVSEDWHKQRGEIERLREVYLIAEDVVWYDWSNNDSDAVHAMEQLRLVLGSALKE